MEKFLKYKYKIINFKIKNLSIFKVLIIPQLIFYFSIKVNKGFTLDSHSLGSNLQYYSEIFPSTFGVFQPHRILLPFLSHIINLEIQIINIISLAVLNLCIFLYFENKIGSINTALVLLCLNTTMFFQFHIIFGGYPDIFAYLLLFLTYVYKDKRFLPYVTFFCALLTKETVIFTLLFFLFLKNISKVKFFTLVIIYLPLYIFFSTGKFDPGYYIEPITNDLFYWLKTYNNNLLIGVFSSIKYLWLIFILPFFKKPVFDCKPVLFLILGIAFQFIFAAADTTRFVSFIFLGIIYLLENLPKKYLSFYLSIIMLLNLLTPKYYVYAGVNDNLLILNQTKFEIINLSYYLNYFFNF